MLIHLPQPSRGALLGANWPDGVYFAGSLCKVFLLLLMLNTRRPNQNSVFICIDHHFKGNHAKGLTNSEAITNGNYLECIGKSFTCAIKRYTLGSTSKWIRVITVAIDRSIWIL